MRVNCKVSNKEKAYIITVVVIFINLITVFLPLFIYYIFPNSKLSNIFFTFPGVCFFVFGVFFLFYILFTGVYHFEFRLDEYIIEVRSKRTISSFLNNKEQFVEMPNSTIVNYAFFDRPFSFNTTLMLKLRVSSRRVVAKRFNFAFLSKIEKEEILDSLVRIIQKKSNQLDE